MDKVRKGALPWTRIDDLHRMILDQLLEEFRIEGVTEEEKDHWNRVWHRLKPWPDCVPGLTRLKRKYIIAPLSNGNIALLTNMAKHSGLPWDAILGAELVKRYKPDREVYLSAADFLGVKPEETHDGCRSSRRFGGGPVLRPAHRVPISSTRIRPWTHSKQGQSRMISISFPAMRPTWQDRWVCNASAITM